MAEARLDEEAIFKVACQISSPQGRAAHLEQACGDDRALRERVELLLRLHDEQASFLERPAARAAATLDEPVLERPGAIVGPYKLLEQIGEGGMGTVFMAEQSHPVQRKVALKVIKAGMDSGQVIARFEAERQALALMDHPNIAKVLDAGTTSAGRPYFVMELVKGVPITTYCDENHLPPKARLELFTQVCHAVQHAHQKGIIHRDLKPTNVLVALYDDKPVPKVIDFGVAKATGQPLTERTMFTGYGQIVGTLEYMSPEQARLNALDIDTRGDIYSLGVLLYELLTGTTPFDKKRLREAAFDEMLRMIREEEPPKPSTKLSAADGLPTVAANRGTEPAKLTRLVRGELDWIVMKALEKDRNRRYETANGFAMDVQRYLADEPVQACPPSMTYRLRKLLRRNKAAVITTAVVALALVVGMVVSTWQAIRATIAESQATENAIAADKARAEAVANLQTARQAVDHMLTEVASVDLAEVPQMEPIRRALLEKALKFYQGFLKDRSSDPSTRDGAGKAYRRMGWIHRELGQHREAEQAVREAISLFEGLVAEYPAVPSYRTDLAHTEGHLASALLHLGRVGEAEKSYRRTYELRRQLSAEFPDNLTYLRDQADAADGLGGVLAHLGRRSEAEKAFEEAHTLLEKLGGDPATTERAKAKAAVNSSRPEDAKQHYRRALQILEDRSAASPQNPVLRRALAYTKLELGQLLKSVDERPELERILREAISHSSQLVNDFPSTAQYRAILAESYRNLLRLLVAQGRFEEAEHVYQTSVPHIEKLVIEAPDRRWYQELHQTYLLCSAEIMTAVDRPQEAEQAYRQAMAISLKMLIQFPDDQQALSCAVNGYSAWGAWLRKAGRLPEAEQVFREAYEQWQKLSERQTGVNDSLERRQIATLHALAGVLSQSGQTQKAAEAFEQLLKIQPAAPVTCHRLAWLLVTCPDKDLRKPQRALELAQKAVELNPKVGDYWCCLGVARYRLGDWNGAIESINKAVEVTGKPARALDGFVRAMAYWQLDDKEQAREWYDKAVQWMEANAKDNAELIRFRAESEELMRKE